MHLGAYLDENIPYEEQEEQNPNSFFIGGKNITVDLSPSYISISINPHKSPCATYFPVIKFHCSVITKLLLSLH